MEISTTTSHATSGAKVTSHYWGYREMTADEVSAVSGGDIGDYSDGGDRGYGDGAAGGFGGGNYASANVNGVNYSTTTGNQAQTGSWVDYVTNSLRNVTGWVNDLRGPQPNTQHPGTFLRD